jgi:hypothetical protein
VIVHPLRHAPDPVPARQEPGEGIRRRTSEDLPARLSDHPPQANFAELGAASRQLQHRRHLAPSGSAIEGLPTMDTSSPLPPLLVAEGYDLTLFRSQQRLGGYLEPWFVEVEYRACDGLGRPLELCVIDLPDEPVSGFLKRIRREAPHVEARLSDPTPPTSDDCATYLRNWLPKVGGPEMPPSASLPELLVQRLVHGDIR